MMTRSSLSCTIAALAMIGSVSTAIAEQPREPGRWLSARAHHEHGDRGPQWPTSSADQGIYRVDGFRVYQASAVHPFLIGFYASSSSERINSAEVLLRRRGRGWGRGPELWVNVPLGD
jgi:hypothetical protein